ncbi:MAG: glutaminyl-peptide cyclotransferase [Candidatus Kapabacteria bacterium]|nr:glutaminyl-peptide cyclotransferase [Candidatus Kapabacteria bacterium]
MLAGCSTERPADEPRTDPGAERPAAVPARDYTYKVIETYPHDVNAFTQGLVVQDGAFLESTGQYGFSSLRRVSIKTGKVERIEKIDARYFGEGMTVLNGRVYMLTYLNQQGFIFDVKTLRKIGEFSYFGEGWGLTNDGSRLYMSNGTSVISVHDPDGFRVLRSINVTLNGNPVLNLNELEWINGEIWANVWQTEKILRISPETGIVTGVIDMAGILPTSSKTPTTDVFNGIAWDSAHGRVYVTGKNWPSVFQIEVL